VFLFMMVAVGGIFFCLGVMYHAWLTREGRCSNDK
jgi:hypothetical protein